MERIYTCIITGPAEPGEGGGGGGGGGKGGQQLPHFFSRLIFIFNTRFMTDAGKS